MNRPLKIENSIDYDEQIAKLEQTMRFVKNKLFQLAQGRTPKSGEKEMLTKRLQEIEGGLDSLEWHKKQAYVYRTH